MKISHACLLGSVCLLLAQPLAAIAGETTIKGAVYGADWDASGKAVAVSVLTPEGDELFIQHSPVGDELLKLIEQNVNVTGTVETAKDGKKVMTVVKYEVAYN